MMFHPTRWQEVRNGLRVHLTILLSTAPGAVTANGQGTRPLTDQTQMPPRQCDLFKNKNKNKTNVSFSRLGGK